MHERYSRNTGVALVALLLAGCGGGGGGGSDDTAVSAAPEATAPVAAAPAAAGPVPAVPAAAGSPTAAPSGVKPDPANPEDPAPLSSVPGALVWAALQTGVSYDPNPPFPNNDFRRVFLVTDKVLLVTNEESWIYLGGASGSVGSTGSVDKQISFSSPGERVAEVRVTGSDGVIDAVTGNGLTLVGDQLDLRNVNPAIDATAATWTNGEWSAKLVIQSTGDQDRIRVCWNVHLPPLSTGPRGPTDDTVPIKRLMCGIYSEPEPGPDIGGYVEDDFSGTLLTYYGTWPENAN